MKSGAKSPTMTIGGHSGEKLELVFFLMILTIQAWIPALRIDVCIEE
jgi:hypothetical protein